MSKGLADVARHVIGYHVTNETRVHNVLDDVAGNMCARAWQIGLAMS